MAEKRLPFLSPEWFAAVRRIQEVHADEAAAALAGQQLTMNAVVTEMPSGGEHRFHIRIEDGRAEWGDGEIDEANVSLTLDYETAKTVILGGDPQQAMQAFVQGRIQVEGDMTKLMALQGGAASGGGETAAAIREITE